MADFVPEFDSAMAEITRGTSRRGFDGHDHIRFSNLERSRRPD
jgi:hypothetical protein